MSPVSCRFLPTWPRCSDLFVRSDEREEMFVKLVKQYGKILKFEGMTATCDPQLMRRLLLRKAHTLPRSILYRVLAKACPSFNGILSCAGDDWKRRHRAFTPLFTGGHIAQYAGAIHEALLEVMQLQAALGRRPTVHEASANMWKPSVAGGTGGIVCKPIALHDAGVWRDTPLGADRYAGADLLSLIRWASLRVLLQWGFGMCPDTAEARSLGREFHYYVGILQDVYPYAQGSTKLWAYAQLWVSAFRMKALVHTVLDKQLYLQDAASASTDGPGNFVTAMLAADFPAGDIVSEMNHIHGAHKAAALATTMAMFELSRPQNASWRECVLAEFECVLGERTHPERADLGSMPVLAAVLDEVLRLHVVSFGTMRMTGAAEQHGDACLPEGSEMQLWLHALHRHPEHFPQPDVFDPHRFLGRHSTPAVPVPSARVGQLEVQPGTYYPFLDGQRRCAGMHLARLEMAVMLHALLRQWDVRVTSTALRKLPDMFVGIEGPVQYTVGAQTDAVEL